MIEVKKTWFQLVLRENLVVQDQLQLRGRRLLSAKILLRSCTAARGVPIKAVKIHLLILSHDQDQNILARLLRCRYVVRPRLKSLGQKLSVGCQNGRAYREYES